MAAGGAAATAAQHWRALLAAALDSNAHLKHSTYFQLATVSVNGRPANRTVVFRGFQEGSDNILINTDSRTRKIEEINQFHYGEQRKESWFASSLKSRLQYLRPVPRLPVLEESSEDYQLDPSIGPLDSFCLLVFNPEQVDYVNLKRNVRFLFTSSRSSDQSNNAWQIEKVNP
ncbi:pyridoxine/pyridoxamine 5'-phosphate oxidase 2 isoform X3 [Phalaenopsis equestris]|uniref:pyridoxine/pyridoxamine 5'-phosphate oxidase 2 isoform X3 n=1 Tax=Phalaenopsis equestris TaxID=78828 RepID=UPI0009E1D938|nr:pyridoxine/pyridoxamine 5'-phosphate oxidase 2 isoform X3 [Phalaenopsis equestris]